MPCNAYLSLVLEVNKYILIERKKEMEKTLALPKFINPTPASCIFFLQQEVTGVVMWFKSLHPNSMILQSAPLHNI